MSPPRPSAGAAKRQCRVVSSAAPPCPGLGGLRQPQHKARLDHQKRPSLPSSGATSTHPVARGGRDSMWLCCGTLHGDKGSRHGDKGSRLDFHGGALGMRVRGWALCAQSLTLACPCS